MIMIAFKRRIELYYKLYEKEINSRKHSMSSLMHQRGKILSNDKIKTDD